MVIFTLKYSRIILVVTLLGAVTVSGFAQEILTASAFFDKVAQTYSKVNDYIAQVVFSGKGVTMKGTLSYRAPNMIRIDFSDPKDQVLVSNGKVLKIYMPKYAVVFRQTLTAPGNAGGKNGGNTPAVGTSGGGVQLGQLGTKEGLSLLRKSYSIAYLNGPDPVPLDDGSSEMVVKLKLDWRTTSEGFRQLNISIGKDGYIRRIVGVDVGYEQFQFDFLNIKVNQNIPPTLFEYDAPGSANIIDNFLFGNQN